MRLFISYARIDKPYCIQLVQTLKVHDVWYDERLYAGQRWWRAILRRLDWSEGFIYLLSPDSVSSAYCLKELEIAQKLERTIIPILIHPETEIPQTIADLQFLDMSNGLNIENVTQLLNSLYRAAQQKPKRNGKSVASIAPATKETPVTQSAKIIGLAASALEAGQYDRAVFLLKHAKNIGYRSRFINIDVLLAEAELALEEQTMQREAARDYYQIVELFKFPVMRERACEFFAAFQEEYPEYDPKGLAEICRRLSQGRKPPSSPALPLLHWRDIPDGIVRVEDLVGQGRDQRDSIDHVDAFRISKYPVTIEQFQAFVNDPEGYENDRWWKYSRQAYTWHKTHVSPLASHFKGDDRPRETVNWYEAMAFSAWLGALLKMNILLPTVAQWQRAAQGDDDRVFPWGNHYEEDHCNTRESKLKMTTPVNRYSRGASSFGVFDMAGNVWEWCLDQTEPGEDETDYKRVVIGGSFVSPCERAQASFRYYLNPESRYSSIGFRIVAMPIRKRGEINGR